MLGTATHRVICLTAIAKIYTLMSRTIVNDEFGKMEKEKWSN
jgi:hypothetical protein